jgi:hypothetical protein
MQTKTQDTDPQGRPPGDTAREWQGNGGTGADSALAHLKQQERHRAGLRSPDPESRGAQAE